MFRKIFLSILILFTASICADAQVVINEYCGSTTNMVDEDGDYSDWIELYNVSDSDVNLANWHLSDDVRNLSKWTFPEITIRSKSFLCIYASGKDRYECSEGKVTYPVPLIGRSTEFRYAVGSKLIDAKWYSDSFDDKEWEKGVSGFGYGNSNVETQVPSGTMSIFVRNKFQVNGIDKIDRLVLNLDYDDGFVVYINGVEVARENLGKSGVDPVFDEASPSYVNPLISNGKKTLRINLSDFRNYLREGENTFAARIHNVSNTSSDLLLIPFLTAMSTEPGNGSVDDILDLSPENDSKNLHANFSLSSEGESLFLTDASNNIIHKTDGRSVPNNKSRGLLEDGSGTWAFYEQPTFGYANTTKAYLTDSACAVFFDPPGGFYATDTVVMLTSNVGGPIYYTTNGEVPTPESDVFTEPIEVYKTTVIRAIAFSDSLLSGQPSTQSYLFVRQDINLPVFSLVTDPYNLYDYNYGIYVEGPNAATEDPHYGANYHQDWERPMHVELYWTDGRQILNQDAGVKIAGAWSRASAQKSFALHARGAYGNDSFDFHPFNSKEISHFRSFLLRNSGNDIYSTMFRDAMITGLVRNRNIDIQAYRPSVVYLNGSYWGILNMREKISKYYLEDNHSYVSSDDVDLLESQGSVIEGGNSHYRSMNSFLTSNSMANDNNYEYVKTIIDVDEFMEYMVLEIYCNNGDWPGNNVKFWHPQMPDGRWRWVAYDTDFGFGLYDSEYDNDMLSSCIDNSAVSATILRKLLANSQFKRDFINRFADRFNVEFSPAVVTAYIDSLANDISDEIVYHNRKWKAIGNWKENVNAMKTFARNRPQYMRDYIRSRFSVGNDVSLTVNVSDSNAGYVQLNSLIIDEFPWKGTYFAWNPIVLRAIPAQGYRFVRWIENDEESPELIVALGKNSTFTALFEPDDVPYGVVVINEINHKSASEQDTRDWIELFNTTATDIDISDWTMKSASDTSRFVFPKGTVIPAYGYLVVCENKKRLLEFWSETKNAIGNFKFGMKKDDAILLYDRKDILIDEVEYGNSPVWPKKSNNAGATLSLSDPFADNSKAYVWEKSVAYGTPGFENDNFYPSRRIHIADAIDENANVAEIYAMCYPNPFADNAAIVWEQSADANVVVELFTAQGQMLSQLADDVFMQGLHQIDISHVTSGLGAGLYFAKVTIAGHEPVIIRMIKQ